MSKKAGRPPVPALPKYLNAHAFGDNSAMMFQISPDQQLNFAGRIFSCHGYLRSVTTTAKNHLIHFLFQGDLR